jgi:rhamnulokinase
LLDARRRAWSDILIGRLGLPTRLFGEIVQPGDNLGVLLPDLVKETGLSGCDVVAVGSHDTASAVAAVPFGRGAEQGAYLSSGTWSLMGIETAEPIINAKSSAYGFTNEGGVCDTIRVLKNICGLWLVQECRRVWAEQGEDLDFGTLTDLAEEAPAFGAFINPDAQEFAAPGDMPSTIAAYCERTGQRAPSSRGATIRTALESLAFRYRAVFALLEDLAGHRLDRLHVVGGGVRNGLLNQFTANALDRPVIAGPVEATSAGNILLQMLAAGDLATVHEGRDLVRRSFPSQTYEPGATGAWSEAYTSAAPHVAT